MSMTDLQRLREANRKREVLWNKGSNEPTPIGFRATEFAGEAGELCNAIKKLLRHEMGMVGGSSDQQNLKEEIGDVLISLERIAEYYDLDLWECTVDKFNKTSDKHGFDTKLDL